MERCRKISQFLRRLHLHLCMSYCRSQLLASQTGGSSGSMPLTELQGVGSTESKSFLLWHASFFMYKSKVLPIWAAKNSVQNALPPGLLKDRPLPYLFIYSSFLDFFLFHFWWPPASLMNLLVVKIFLMRAGSII